MSVLHVEVTVAFSASISVIGNIYLKDIIYFVFSFQLLDQYDTDFAAPYPGTDYAVQNNPDLEEAIWYLNRKIEELKWERESRSRSLSGKMTISPKSLASDYDGEKINFQEIELGVKIGQGGFGDVYSATWRDTNVAVKKLRVQRVSKRRLQEFTAEVLKFCHLDHPNIVKFIGACVVTPNLAIVMEYMQTNLFDALHLDDAVDFSDESRWSILRQTTFGLSYLHEKKMAHCDLKSQNVLLNDVTDENVVAKITDFGLSMVKNDAETSQSQGPEELVRNVGTPRYSAPEVLRGELLSVKAMKQADIYSLALIIYEVMIEEEPFYNMNYAQLRKQVGDGGRTPDIPDDVALDGDLEKVMKACWHFDPHKRPDVEEVLDVLN